MQWGPQQAAALDAIGVWLKDNSRQVFRLHGFAGSGKTTLARHIADTCGGRVLFVAPTGKAADVLRRKGCHGAATIHSTIYRVSKGNETRLQELRVRQAQLMVELTTPGATVALRDELAKIELEVHAEKQQLSKLRFVLNEDSEVKDADLVICDEGSMVSVPVSQDLLSFGVKVLVLGDPFQLPPVRSGPSLFAHEEHEYLLTEVHRQAKDNPVLRLATEVREKGYISRGQHGDSLVEDWRAQPSPELVRSFDQLLVGTNKLRIGVNRRYRELLGHARDADPQPGERLVCLKNNRDLGLFNGQQWLVNEAGPELAGVRAMQLRPFVEGDGEPLSVDAAEEAFWAEKPPQFIERGVSVFTYAYGMTVHKAQGSEWPSVLVFADWPGRDFNRWLYTAVTRAQQRVHVLLR